MTDKFPVPKLIYDRRILVDGSMVYVDEKGIVLGVAVSGDFPKGIIIGQQLSLIERREMEYENRGCTIEALIVALWEMVVENRPDAAAALELVRERVKEDISQKSVSKERHHVKR
jgi:hypothetical protein